MRMSPNQIKNFQLTPEQRAENVRRAAAMNKRRGDQRRAEIYRRYMVEGLSGKPKPEAAKALGISTATLRRAIKRIAG